MNVQDLESQHQSNVSLLEQVKELKTSFDQQLEIQSSKVEFGQRESLAISEELDRVNFEKSQLESKLNDQMHKVAELNAVRGALVAFIEEKGVLEGQLLELRGKMDAMVRNEACANISLKNQLIVIEDLKAQVYG